MTPEQWTQAVTLWNEGKTVTQISEATGVPVYGLTGGNSLLGAVMAEIRRRMNAGEKMDENTKIFLPVE
jgi:hypothetical protein